MCWKLEVFFLEIIYIGHSSFLLKTSIGKKILMDPFKCKAIDDNLIGSINLVTVSHSHLSHCYVDPFKDKCKILMETGSYEETDLRITGISTYHDRDNGFRRGDNLLFIYELEGLKLCHLGDLGHIPKESTLSFLENLDVIFIPIGGNFTLNSKEACSLCKIINPKIIIPMHYKDFYTTSNIQGVEDFIFDMKNGEKVCDASLVLKNSVGLQNKVLILNPLR